MVRGELHLCLGGAEDAAFAVNEMFFSFLFFHVRSAGLTVFGMYVKFKKIVSGFLCAT